MIELARYVKKLTKEKTTKCLHGNKYISTNLFLLQKEVYLKDC